MRKIYQSSLTLALGVWLLLMAFTASAQQRLITGVVKDESGTPLPGVSILLKGTSIGTATDANGVYKLQTNVADAILVFSFIGYQAQEVAAGNRTQVDVTMQEDVEELQEVLVVGYGVQKKALNTGANLQVKGEDMQRLSTTNALQALQGKTPGVQITSTSGQPGENIKVNIRGLGTSGNASPLYVVDGVITTDISYLNPADIESIDVLKDAASAAIYGSQAANGVVLVTTRKASKGTRAQITFDAFYGLQNVARKAQMLDSREYATIMNEAAVNSGKSPYFTNEQIAAMGKGTNWMDQMFVKDAPTQSYTLGASGGTEASVYSASLSYLSQEGIVGGKSLSNYERYNFRINTEHKLYSNIVTLGENLSFAYVKNNGIAVGDQYSNSLRAAFNTNPFIPMYDSLGNFWDNSNSTWYNGDANPYATMVYTNQNRRDNQKLIGNLYLQVEPIKNLKFRTSIGLDYTVKNERSFIPVYRLSIYTFNNQSKVTQSTLQGNTVMWDNLVSYGFDLPGGHRFDAMVGSSAFQYRGNSLWATNTDLTISNLKYAWLSNATNTNGTTITIGGSPDYDKNNDPISEDIRMSYFGRLNYNYNEKYMVNATFRVDGSSRFARGNRWGYFPSISAGWILTEEDFMSDISWLRSLKLRASWGQVGNQNVEFFQYLATLTTSNTNYSFGPEEGALTPGAYPSRLANANLRWETSEQTNVGFDAVLMDGLTATVDWYVKKTKDWLVKAPILATAGANAPYINGGSVRNSGVELGLTYNSSVGDFKYTVNLNGAYNKNKVGNIPTQDGIIHGSTNQLYNNAGEFYRAQNGLPIGYFWGLKTNGIFQSEEEVATYRSSEGTIIQPDAKPGDVRYVDRDDNGVINDSDKTIIGNPNPDFTLGFFLSGSYKGFDLSIQASGVTGNQIVQSYRSQTNQYANYTTAILDRWHGPGSSNSMPRVTENSNNWVQFSDLYIHNGDYLRINNVTVGYDFTKMFHVKFVNQVRIYASALNLLTFTKYTGMDPEVGYGILNKTDQSDRFSSGIDLGYYPRPRTLMVGLNVKF